MNVAKEEKSNFESQLSQTKKEPTQMRSCTTHPSADAQVAKVLHITLCPQHLILDMISVIYVIIIIRSSFLGKCQLLPIQSITVAVIFIFLPKLA